MKRYGILLGKFCMFYMIGPVSGDTYPERKLLHSIQLVLRHVSALIYRQNLFFWTEHQR